MEAIALGVAANLSSEAANGTFQEVKRHVRYVIVHNKIVEKFDDKMKLLIAKRESVQQEVDAAERNLEKIKADVQLWCERVDKTIDEEVKKVKDLEDKAKAKCFIGICPNIKSRYRLSRKAEEDVAVVDELLQEGQFDRVATRDAPEVPITAAPKNFNAFDSRKEVFDEILEALKASNVNVIGVYGTGGVGKTTLVKEVARQVEEANLFCPVIHVTVTLTPNIEKIQDQIADSLSLKLEERSIAGRARLLSKRLKKEKKILIVLDDIWARLDLEEVGISFGDQHSGCKMLMTSRKRNVLINEMDAEKAFEISVLKDHEVWDLFKKMAGIDFENQDLLFVAIEVAKRCAGLPLAIVTVARALRNKGLYAWEDALRQLQRPSPTNFTGIPATVYSAIELSYKNLESEELKQTFLLSCLLGCNAHMQDLLRYAFGLRLFDGVNTIEETRNRLLTMVSDLKASCLLLDGYDDDRLVMPDFVCDVALAISFRDNQAFALRHGDVSEDWPNEEIMKRFEMISLSFASIIKLPHQLECPRLSLFSMTTSGRGSYLKMPTTFFKKMKNIKVLDMIQMDFSSSPSSISLLTSLRTLCLKSCKLRDMTNFGKLKNLEILSLSGSDIRILPKEIGQLKKLRLLDLSFCSVLRTIPPGVLSSLSRLEELYMSRVFIFWSNAYLDELKELSCLTTLDIWIPDVQLVPKDLFSERLQRYKILMGGKWDWPKKFEYSRTLMLEVNTSIEHLDHGFKGLLKNAEALYLANMEGVKIALNQVGYRDYFLHLGHLHIQNAFEVQYVMNANDANDKIVFHKLRSLTLENLPQLISFCSKNTSECSTSVPQLELPLFSEQMELPCLENLCLSSINVGRIRHNQFSNMYDNTLENLTSLIIKDCGNLKYILSSSMARSLINLKSFEIFKCKSLREIIFTEDVEEEGKVNILFPRLSTLRMEKLQHLMGYCSENYTIAFPSLKKLEIEECPKLKGFIHKSTIEENRPPSMQVVFDEKVAFPQLKELSIAGLKNCKRIWHDQLIDDSFSKLNQLWVRGCDRLLNVFPFNMKDRLQNLEEFQVGKCNSLEEIFESQVLNTDELHTITAAQSIMEETTTNFVFPKLKYLMFSQLPRLKRFYSGMHTTEWPSLKSMWLYGCDMVEIFASERLSFGELTNQQPFFWANEVTFPNLEELRLEWNNNLRKIWHGQLRADVFSQLRVVELKRFPDTSAIFPHCFIQSLPNLEKLDVSDAGFRQIFNLEGFGGNEIEALALTSLNELRLAELPQLTHLWKEEYNLSGAFCELRSLKVWDCGKLKNLVPSSVSFENLTTLEVSRCHGFVNLIACSTAKSLVQLTRMSITDCEMIEEIIACECDEVKDGIVFTQLVYLQLSCLPSLSSFCSRNHVFEFPALTEIIVRECPKMKGDLSAPQLQKVISAENEDEERGWWPDYLTTTIKVFLFMLLWFFIFYQMM